MRKSLTIRQLLLLAFITAGLLPAILVSFLSFSQARSALSSEITRDMQALSDTVAHDVEHMMFERFQNVHSWTELAVMQALQVDDIDKQLTTFLLATKQSYGNVYHAIEVVNIHGKVVASSIPTDIGHISKLPPNWFNSYVEGSTHIASNQLTVSKLDHEILAISQEIIAPETGLVIGRLNAMVNWRIIQGTLNQSSQDATAVALFDVNHQLIAASSNWGAINPKAGFKAYSKLDNDMMPKWEVLVEKSLSVSDAPAHRLGYVFVALLISTLIFSALLVVPIAQAITLPISELTNFVRHFKQGFYAHPPQSGSPEIRELGSAFEKLLVDLEKSQSDLTRAAKLAVVGEMAAAMSHEVRTPLGILRSSADILNREPNLSKDGHEVLGFIISETERLNNLVSSLIDAARPRLPSFIEINLTELVNKTIALLNAQAQAKNILITFKQNQTITALIDSDQIMQVLMNLLMNAIQILPNGGLIDVRLNQTSEKTMLSVADNGPGILVDNQAQIFEPFFTQRAGGVGLGLAVVRQIVHAHHGEITYQPSHMHGAEFIISLPNQAV